MKKLINLRKISQTFKKLVFIMIIVNCTVCCAQKTNQNKSKQWKEVISFGKVKQGIFFKIEPLKDTTLLITGSESFNIISLNFKCHLLQSTIDIKYTSASTVQSSDGLSETNKASELQTWPMNVKEKNIKLNIPLFTKYRGKGLVYLYLVDPNDNCISNIIAWNIEFK